VERYSTVIQATGDNIIWRMRVAFWIPKVTNTHSECVILICFSTATTVTQTCLNITLYVQCVSCLILRTMVIKIDRTVFGAPAVVIIKIPVLWDVTPCSLINVY
jgi:hypothetical protein